MIAQAIGDPTLSCLQRLRTMASNMFVGGGSPRVMRRFITALQKGDVSEQVSMCSWLSIVPHPSLHLSLSALRSRLRVKMALWSSLHQCFSSQASEKGVFREAQIFFHGIGGPGKRFCHAASQLGRVLPMYSWVRKRVIFLTVRSVIPCMGPIVVWRAGVHPFGAG